MFLSVFDIFKIGIGPSSSHTVGPMLAAARFIDIIRKARDPAPGAGTVAHISCSLHGSLAFTGKGHATDRAVMLGLSGFHPGDFDPGKAEIAISQLLTNHEIKPDGLPAIRFDPDKDLIFDFGPPLKEHSNGMIFTAFDKGHNIIWQTTFYSTGGGMIATAAELSELHLEPGKHRAEMTAKGYPFPFATARGMLDMAARSGKSIADMKRANELHDTDLQTLNKGLDGIWQTMQNCIDRGLTTGGELPGGLSVRRRAKAIHDNLEEQRIINMAMPHVANDWMSVYAIAVNEENAAGGQVVTAPTNGAAGVVPAVMRYYRDHCAGSNDQIMREFLLTAAAIGGLIRHNASISGAEVGCQGEVGSASAMAAAGLAACLGGTPAQIENAAEIALEHHLGMSCDPVAGLVQVPCIERNALGAVKAVSAASLALHGDGIHYMPLDNCIETMRQTGLDMNEKYKETSKGGLAVNLPEC